MRLILICFVLITQLISEEACSQSYTITGQIKTDAGETLPGAHVMLLNPTDSVVITAAVTDEKGQFQIQAKEKTVLLKFSYIGYETHFITKELSAPQTTLPPLVLSLTQATLKQATVEGQLLPVQQKGDTTEMNADAFKVNKDANAEDLVTKMPGITLEEGKVKAQGEDVKQVMVDGKPFFGDDPNAVLKNLPAEVIDKIQVFDKKSDQSAFTGFDDGNTTKTLNIITRPQFRNGTFGKIQAGYGSDDHYKLAFNYNAFKEKRRLSILGNLNNINEQNFSSEDLLGVMSSTSRSGRLGSGSFSGRSGGPPRGGSGGSGSQDNTGSFLVDQKNGITETNALGINYSNTWRMVEFSGSYFFNYTDNNTSSVLSRTYVTPLQEGLLYTEDNGSNTGNYNHRMNLRFDWKMDSANSLLVQPRLSYQKNNGRTLLTGLNSFTDSLVSSTSNIDESDFEAFNGTVSMLYRHSFKKTGRTLSVSATPGYNENEGDQLLLALSTYYADSLTADTLNQIYNLNKEGYVVSGNATYTEPVNKSNQLYFNTGANYNYNNSAKKTYDYSESYGSYESFNALLSNVSGSNYLSGSVGAGYRYQQKKWNASVGISVQQAQLKNNQEFPELYNLNKTFFSVLPNAFAMYRLSDKKNFRFSYRSVNTSPTITQLQEVINNSNPLQLSTGSNSLEQDFQHNVSLRYSSVNTEKSTAFFAFINLTSIQSYIGNTTYIATTDSTLENGFLLPAGSQISVPENFNGYYNARTFVNYSLPLKKLKSNLSLNAGAGYMRQPSAVNTDINYANNTNTNIGISLASNISEKIDFTISTNASFNSNVNSIQQDQNNNYFNQYSRIKFQATVWKGLVVQTDLNHQYYNGLDLTTDETYILWNAAIGYRFLKNNAAELRISAYDLLDQNNSLTRNATDLYYEDVQTNVLQQYFMLSFIYNLKNFGANRTSR